MKVFGQLEKSQIENLTVDPTGTGLVPARMWYRTDTKRFKVYDGAVVQEFVDLDTAQTLVNKILTSPTLTTPEISGATIYNEVATPSTPSANKNKVYFKTDGFPYYLDDAGVERRFGSGTGFGDVGTYALFNAEDISILNFTNIALNATTPIAGIYDYSVSAYTATFPVITLPERSKTKLNGIELHYKMTSGTAKLVIKDNAANVLVEQEISSTVIQKVSLQFWVSSSVTSVQLEVQNVSSATGLKIDDVKFTDSPFVGVKLDAYNSIILQGNDGRAITANTEDMFFSGSGVGWTGGADGAASNYAVQYSNSLVKLKGGIAYTAGATNQIFLYKNSVLYRTIDNDSSVPNFSFISTKGEFAKGDLLSLRVASGGTLDNTASKHWMNILEETESENLVFNQSGTENIFSARFTGAGAIVTQSSPFIASVVNGATGQYTITFLAGFFPVIPSVNGTAEVLNRDIAVSSISTSQVVIQRYISSTVAAENGEFTIIVQRQGTDYKNPNAYAVVPSSLHAFARHSLASGSNAGTFTSGAWQTRPLNTLDGDTGFISLAANQITLPAGKYKARGWAAVKECGGHQLRIQNITDASTAVLGLTSRSTPGQGESTPALVEGIFTITTAKVFELQHRCGITRATDGFGSANTFGTNEIFAELAIEKLS